MENQKDDGHAAELDRLKAVFAGELKALREAFRDERQQPTGIEIRLSEHKGSNESTVEFTLTSRQFPDVSFSVHVAKGHVHEGGGKCHDSDILLTRLRANAQINQAIATTDRKFTAGATAA